MTVLLAFICPLGVSANVAGKGSLHTYTKCETAISDSLRGKMRDNVTLGEVVVDGNSSQKDIQMRSALNTVSVGKSYIEANFGGSLMQSLSRLPGVKAMSIGSGESKPTIRGLGFNRLVVAENGIKHQGQQWGEDHGLETDQFAVDRVDVIKGPAALLYGSDAIGGVIDLHSDDAPREAFEGSVNTFFRSNNESLGLSSTLGGRMGRFFYKANVTLTDYADYKVPTDSIEYYSYNIRLHNRRLRNTAGHELDGSLMWGYEHGNVKSYLRLSNVNLKSGFFANAHGLEVRLSDIDYDSSRRDIDLPYHSDNHLMIANHTEVGLHRDLKLHADLAFQDNIQEERSEPISHGYMPIPPNTLERRFSKQTYSANIGVKAMLGKNSITGGTSVEYQHNRRGGWGFILPDFESFAVGAFVYDRYVVSDNLILSAGVRYDLSRIRIHSYRDWYKTPTSVAGDSAFIQRSADLSRSFNSFTWSAGVNYTTGPWVLKMNVGKSFRMPIAKELGMDGINYHIFRYEKGNTNLDPEEAYELDAGIIYEHGPLLVELSPYITYFPNYIYLCPTDEYKEGLQLYNYTQCEVLRYGFEAEARWKFTRDFELSANGEYLYARQESGDKKGYTLPFSTPWSASAELRYNLPTHEEANGGFAAVEFQVVGRQDQIVPPEKKTPGHGILNASLGKSFKAGGSMLSLTLQLQNILNKRYYDHTSYYRLIDVPEPGFNVSLMAGWKF